MKSLRLWALLVVGIPAAFLIVATGCDRKLNVTPTAASLAPTSTFTVTATFNTYTPTSTLPPPLTSTSTASPTSSNTATSTVTLTPTITNTPNGPTYTSTNTYTITATATITVTPTITSTSSNTLTLTQTSTSSPTATATVNTNLIDDLEDGDGQINTNLVNTAGNAGYWFTFGDTGCTLNPAVNATMTPVLVADGVGGSSRVAQLTGSGCNSYGGGIGFNFLNNGTNPKLPYSVPSSLTGVRFDIRMAPGTSVSSVRFGVADATTAADSGNYGADLVATSAWKSVTIYFSWMSQPNWAAPAAFDMTQVYGLQWQVNNSTGASIGLQIDNVSFVNTIAPPTFTPVPVDTRTISNFIDGSGRVNTGLANAGGSTGYWYTFAGDTGCAMNPAVGATATPISVPDGPSASTANVMQVTGSGCNTVGGGIGFNFLDNGTGPKLPYSVPSAFTGVRFDYRLPAGITVGSVRFGMSTYQTEPSASGGGCAVSCNNHFGEDLTATTSWQSVTIFFQYMTQQSGWGTPATLDLTKVFGMQWQINNATGANLGLQLDNVQFVLDTPVAPPCPLLIDNMEDNNNMIDPGSASCVRGGAWYCFGDSMFSSTDTPNTWGTSTAFIFNGTLQWTTPSDSMTFKMSSPGATGSNYCARITGLVGASCGSPYNTCPFVGMGFDFRDSGTGPKLPYDVSAFTGMQYDVKYVDAGDGDTTGFRVKFPTYNTTVGYGCSTACSNDFGRDITTNTYTENGVWQTTQVAFSSLTQQSGWGTTTTWDPTKVYSCQWQYTAGSYHYDLSIDNVTFY
jgi:hypothetical protein